MIRNKNIIYFRPSEIKKTISLNLNEVDLYIWEERKLLKNIQKKLEELALTKKLPPIPLCKISERKYFLHPYAINLDEICFDGGHHRSAAYYLADQELIGTIFPSPICDLNQENPPYPKIQEMIVEYEKEEYSLEKFKENIYFKEIKNHK